MPPHVLITTSRRYKFMVSQCIWKLILICEARLPGFVSKTNNILKYGRQILANTIILYGQYEISRFMPMDHTSYYYTLLTQINLSCWQNVSVELYVPTAIANRRKT